MAAFPYRILTEWSAQDECFLARVPALAVTVHGESAAEAASEAVAASTLMLASLRKHKRAIPEGDVVGHYSGKVALRMPASLHADVARLASADNVSVNQELVNLIALGMGRRTG